MSESKLKTILPDVEHWKSMVPCQAACPVRTDAGRYVQLIAEGRYEQAYLVARSPNPLASICGRVCAAPCEDACRRGKIDGPVTIRALKRFVCEGFGPESMHPGTQDCLVQISMTSLASPGARTAPFTRTDLGNQQRGHLPLLQSTRREERKLARVAVVGAGPAGLACAHDLAVMGYRVVLFEASERLGGMMFHGIPEFRLSRAIIEKEIDKIVQRGVDIRTHTSLTPDFGLRDLKTQGFEAVFIALGTQKGRDLAIEGSQLDGVIKAIDYLININNGYRVQLGRKVVVVGGGLVAFDAARMALRSTLEEPVEPLETGAMNAALDAARQAIRSGATEVRMVSLESFDEMPVMKSAQGREEYEETRKEGVEFHPQRGPRRIVGENGRVKAVEFIGVKRTYDENGRFNPEYDTNISETMEADTVILAIGQRADLSFLKPEDGVELTPAGTIKVDPETLTTSAPGIYAGGDVAFGPRNLIDAIANGKRAALSIDDYLRHRPGQLVFHLSIEKIPTRSYQRSEGYERCQRQAPPTVELNRRTGISEVETGYSPEEAQRQAERCLYCHIQTIYDPDKCVLCNRCVDVCPEFCLKLVPLDHLDLDSAHMGKLLEAAVPGQTFAAMIKDEEKCIRCGLCAIRCPTEAMTMEVFYYEEREDIA
jgi:NADPH-dependent glutamate synthase beta subunit-like oxidoreductase